MLATALGFTPARAAALADRRRGIGCDQFITLEPAPSGSNADAFMRIRNPDGGEAGAMRLTLVSVAVSMLTLLASEAMARLVGRRIGPE